MNTYLVPTTAAYCYEPYDHIYLVYANTSQEAYQKTRKNYKENIYHNSYQNMNRILLNCINQMILLLSHFISLKNMIYL